MLHVTEIGSKYLYTLQEHVAKANAKLSIYTAEHKHVELVTVICPHTRVRKKTNLALLKFGRIYLVIYPLGIACEDIYKRLVINCVFSAYCINC
jgi:hypothetical protein